MNDTNQLNGKLLVGLVQLGNLGILKSSSYHPSPAMAMPFRQVAGLAALTFQVDRQFIRIIFDRFFAR